MPGKICSIATCKSNSQRVKEKGEHVMFFSFPKDDEICKQWVERCCRKDMLTVQYKRVCSKHFSLNDYEDQLKAFLMGTHPKTLKKTAVPSLLLPKMIRAPPISDREIQAKKQRQQAIIADLLNETDTRKDLIQVAENEHLKHSQGSISENGSMFEIADDNYEEKPPVEKHYLHCVVPHCTSNGGNNVSFYNFPEDKEHRKKWLEILKLEDKLKDNARVCDLHFRTEVRPRLCKSAVPSINLSQEQILNKINSNSSTGAEMYEINETLENETDAIDSVAQKSTPTINGVLENGNIINNCENIPEKLVSHLSNRLDSTDDDVPLKLPTVANVITKDSFKEMCRCCLINKGEMNVFEAHFENIPISDLINFCTTEKIAQNEDLPRSICQICMQLIISSYTFIKTVKDSQVHVKELEQLFKNNSTINNYETITPNEDIPIQTDDNISRKKQPTNSFKHEFRKLNNVYRELCDVLEQNRKEINRPEKVKDVKLNINYLKYLASRKDSKVKEKAEKGTDFLSSLVEKLPPTVEVHSLPTDVIETNLKKIVYSDFDEVEIKYNNGLPEVSTEKKIPELTCFECSEYFTTEASLSRHSIETGHEIPARYKCKHCSETFHLRRKYKVHLANHRRESRTVCEICGLTIAPRNLGRHLKTHTTKGKQICQICGREFSHKGTLDLHIRYKHSGIPDDSLCFICGRTFRNLALLNRHLNDEHHEEELANKSYSCDKCRKYFASETSLKLHRKCDGGSETMKQCTECSKYFPDAAGLTIHMREAHRENVSHQCPVCLGSFRTVARLKIHLLKHKGGMPYKCTYCAKTFRFKRFFDNHMRTHTEITTYDCSICDKTFSHILLLQRHQQSHFISNGGFGSLKREIEPNEMDEFFDEPNNDSKLLEESNDNEIIEEGIDEAHHMFYDPDSDASS